MHRRLAREMYDRIETAFIKDLCERCIIDIHLDALDRRILRQVLTAARAEVVEYRHLLALGQQFPHKVGADETGAPGH